MAMHLGSSGRTEHQSQEGEAGAHDAAEMTSLLCVDWVTMGGASVAADAGAFSVVLERRVGCLLAARWARRAASQAEVPRRAVLQAGRRAPCASKHGCMREL